MSSIQVVGVVEALIQNADTLFPGGDPFPLALPPLVPHLCPAEAHWVQPNSPNIRRRCFPLNGGLPLGWLGGVPRLWGIWGGSGPRNEALFPFPPSADVTFNVSGLFSDLGPQDKVSFQPTSGELPATDVSGPAKER